MAKVCAEEEEEAATEDEEEDRQAGEWMEGAMSALSMKTRKEIQTLFMCVYDVCVCKMFAYAYVCACVCVYLASLMFISFISARWL